MKPSPPAPPTVLVVVPNLNQRSFLPERFDSLAAQTFRNWRAIVIDGFSSDGSWDYIRERAARDPRIEAFQAEARGPYAAWNEGLRRGSGTYFHIATADDSMTPEFLERMAAALEDNPGYDLAHCRLEIIDARGDRVPDLSSWNRLPLNRHYFGEWMNVAHLRPAPHDGILHAAAGTVYTSINQLLIRRRVFERAGFFREDLGIAADFEWGMRAALLHGAVHVPATLALWRRHPAQLTNDTSNATPDLRRKLADMVGEAITAAVKTDPDLEPILDRERLTRPMRHHALFMDRSLRPWDLWWREPRLIGLDLQNSLLWRRHIQECHIDWIRGELKRLGIAGPLPVAGGRAPRNGGTVFLDVTNSARQRVQTGIQRVVRSLYQHLATRKKVEPLVWSSSFTRYSTLQGEERRNLTDPFRGAAFSSQRPDLLRNPYPWSKTHRYLHHKLFQIDLPRRMEAGDLLFVPEIFQDARVEYFERLLPLPRGKAWTLFYDALVWSLPAYAPADRNPRFERYLAVLARFDGVVCISRESEDDLRRFWAERGIAPCATHALHLPMPLAEARPEAQAAFGNRRVLLVATLEPRKNHLRLLEACRLLWERGIAFELELVGRSVGAGSAPIEAAIAALQAEGRPVRWLTHVDDAALARAYARASFTVYPSIREGFGLPILESLWHGRPCVCGENGALGEVGRGGGCLFVDQTDVPSLAAGIERLLGDGAEYGKLFAEARARRFRNWGDYVEDLLALLEEKA